MFHATVDGQNHEAWPCQLPSGAAFHTRPHSKTGSWGKQCSPKCLDESSGASYCHCGGYKKYPASSICFLRFGCFWLNMFQFYTILYSEIFQDFRMLPDAPVASSTFARQKKDKSAPRIVPGTAGWTVLGWSSVWLKMARFKHHWTHIEQWKNSGCYRAYRGWNPTQLYGD